MENVIKGYKPEKLFGFFEKIASIPHPSGEEAALASYVCDFARERGLEYHRDANNNVLVKKPASPGYEDHPTVLLQGHLDMVCEKNGNTDFDFSRDGLKLAVKDDWLCAEGTTLGADDGAAVAVMLTLLDEDEKTLKHPPLECLFTTEEETGLGGALAFDASLLSASYILNLDSDEEGVAVIGCVGSSSSSVTFEPDYVELFGTPVTVSLGGLAGGHSGMDIDKDRANALLTLARVLNTLHSGSPINFITLSGGNKDNAIPREAEAVIAVTDVKHAEEVLTKAFGEIKGELSDADSRARLTVKKTKASEMTRTKMMSYKSTSNIISFLLLCPCGPIRRNKVDHVFVESSANPASVRHAQDGSVRVTFMNRSSLEISEELIDSRISVLARLTDGKFDLSYSYPGWEPVYDSPLQKLYLSTYEELFPELPKPTAAPIHAGLECGVLAGGMRAAHGKTPDVISIGPAIRGIHTPNEKLELASYERFWKLVTTMLERL